MISYPGPLIMLYVGMLVATLPGCQPDDSQQAVGPPGEMVLEPDQASLADAAPVASPFRFVDGAESAGLPFIPRNGEEAGHLSILESIGTGVGVLDFDGDGHPDLCFAGGGGFDDTPAPVGQPGRLYRNLSGRQFEDVTGTSTLDTSRLYSHGVFPADYDGDGFVDVLITGYSGMMLLHNQGDGTFVETTAGAGLTDGRWSTGAAWADINSDGALDLYVNHYVDWSFENHPDCVVGRSADVCPPAEFAALDDSFYRSTGDGRFRDASTEVGLVPGGKSLGTIAADIDLDGDTDLYVANDTTPNFLYVNDGSGRLTESGLSSGTSRDDSGTANGSMGLDVADLDGDGRLDIWVTNFEQEFFALYRGLGNGLYQFASRRLGVTAVGDVNVGFGTLAEDFDRDGDLDIFVTNGHVRQNPVNAPRMQTPLLFENRSGRRLVNVSSDAGGYLAGNHLGRGLAAADFDQDYQVDLVVTHQNARCALLFNESQPDRHWIELQLVGTTSNRSAIGATITFKCGHQSQIRQVLSGRSYLSGSARRLILAVPSENVPMQLTVKWPSGLRTKLKHSATDQSIVLIEGR